jgi:hypothetical protein
MDLHRSMTVAMGTIVYHMVIAYLLYLAIICLMYFIVIYLYRPSEARRRAYTHKIGNSSITKP